jgi:hypothetical protein
MKILKFIPVIGTLFILCSSTFAADPQPGSEKEPWELAEATEVWEPVPTVVKAPEGQPPSDAQILFGGESLDQWQATDGSEPKWLIENGALVVEPKTGDIKTKDSFCDVQLHVEWMTPTKVRGDDGKILTSQGRNNSGVFLQERYEIQVLDSYKNKTYSNGQAGSVYKQSIPLVNASRPPGVWQSYDIIYTAPRFSSDDKLESPGRVTVLHNGILIQNNVTIEGATAWIGEPKYEAHGCAPVRLQDHGNPVSFRNIWVRKL